MIQAQDSVFVGLTDSIGHERVLMVYRRSGDWWLPGGAIPPTGQIIDHARTWSERLFTCGSIKLPDEHVARWKLSSGNHAYLVKPTIHGLTDLDEVELQIRDGTENEYITSAAAMSIEDIHHHLYMKHDLPWGQAKMALWAMYTQSLTSRHGHQMGDPLKDDIGEFGGHHWRRP